MYNTGNANYPFVTTIPSTGDIFIASYRNWAIVDQNTGLETFVDPYPGTMSGIRGGPYLGGTIMLPLRPENGFRGEVAFMNGAIKVEYDIANDLDNSMAIDTVARIVVDGSFTK